MALNHGTGGRRPAPGSMDSRSDPDAGRLREHVEGVRRLAGHLVRDAHDADDVAQESLLAALGRMPHGIRN